MARGLLLGLAMLMAVGGGCPEPSGVEVELETLLTSNDFPVAIAFASDGRAFYTEKETGLVRVISAAGALLAQPFADVATVSNSERGLLGIALHPDFDQNGYLYVFYTRSSTAQDTRTSNAATDNRVVRFTANGNVADGGEELIVSLPVQPGPRHNAGNIAVGPDGKLYVTIGDLEDEDAAQDIDDERGRILRYNDDGSIPADNPFGADNPTYALGLRNSFDFAFDPVSGELFAAETAPTNRDEINLLHAGSNAGWPLVGGSSNGSPPDVDAGDYVDPIRDYSNGVVVPTGVAFAPDDTYGAASQNALFVGQNSTGRVVRITLNAARDAMVSETTFIQLPTGQSIVDVAFAPSGMMYVVTDTAIHRVLPTAE